MVHFFCYLVQKCSEGKEIVMFMSHKRHIGVVEFEKSKA